MKCSVNIRIAVVLSNMHPTMIHKEKQTNCSDYNSYLPHVDYSFYTVHCC